MQYEEYMTRPESNRKYLVSQVEEQSDLCDVVVKMGVWEKKFHRCVLVISPFFDRALKNNFLEKLKGKIELAIGTPSTLEMAIMFLYEKTPTFTGQNIEHIMNLAEFLLLPNLKSACISWLKSVPITEVNCMKFMQLSGIYDFEMPSCDEYIMSHMTEMLPHTVMNNVSVNSVKYMFSEKTISYVPMDDRVIFLIRWTNSRPTIREKYVKELFEMIDFREVSRDVLDELKANQKMCDVIDFKQSLCHDEKETLNSHPVLIMLRCMTEMTFWCFDLVREKWFRLDSKCHQKHDINPLCDISGAGFTNSEIYFKDCRGKRSNVLHLDLDTDTYKIYKLVRKDTGNDFNFRGFGDFIVFGDMYIAFVNKSITIRKHSYLKLPTKSLTKNSSTLYIGYRNDGNIEMSPKLSFKDDVITNICINKMLTIAIRFMSRSVVSFFDLVDHTIEMMQLKTSHTDKFVQNNGGFVIYNERRCVSLDMVSGSFLSPKFKAKEITFGPTDSKYKINYMYLFRENVWYRFYRNKYRMDVFESVRHDEIMSKNSFDGLDWKQLPLPGYDLESHAALFENRLFHICLPKTKLRCHIECPHCNFKVNASRINTRRVQNRYDSDNFFYDETSNDNFLGFY